MIIIQGNKEIYMRYKHTKRKKRRKEENIYINSILIQPKSLSTKVILSRTSSNL